jgi:hypothetical protein
VLHAIFPDCLEKAQTQILSLLSIFFLNFSQFKYFFGVLGSFLILNLKNIGAMDDDNADKKAGRQKVGHQKAGCQKANSLCQKVLAEKLRFQLIFNTYFPLKNLNF